MLHLSLSLSLREGKGKFPKSQAWEWKEGWGGGKECSDCKMERRKKRLFIPPVHSTTVRSYLLGSSLASFIRQTRLLLIC